MTTTPRPLATALGAAERASSLAVSTAVLDQNGELPARRRRALDDAVSELSAAVTRPDEPRLAMRVYGEGCLALALAGTFDPASVERVRALADELHRLAPVELVVDLSLLRTCGRGLSRALAQLRVQRLVTGARVELHSPPHELTAELGQTPAEQFDVRTDIAHAATRATPL